MWAELERLGVTLYLHPALFPADQWRVFEGHPVLSRPRQLPSHYLRHNLYATTSGVFSHAALLGAVHAIGADRLLFDYPYESTAEAVEFLHTAPFSRADLERVAHGNATHLLHL